jgi:hypothetical protein
VQDFFLYLFCIICLYVSSVSFLSLLYAIIDKYFGDVLFNYYSSSGTKWAIASLVIFFPVYLWLSWIINRSILKFPEVANIGIRKVLYYFTLFIAGLTIAIDLVTLIFYFLDGEITVRFILKVLSVLFVGGIVFGYYFYDLRRDVLQKSSKPKIIAISISLIVIITLIFGFIMAGSPMEARNIKFDSQRISDLSNIQSALTDYYRANSSILPKDLITMSQSASYYGFNIKDPETGVNYEYRIIAQNQYELCANFSLDSSVVNTQGMAYPVSTSDIWTHGVGRVCFDRTVGEIPAVPTKTPPKTPPVI